MVVGDQVHYGEVVSCTDGGNEGTPCYGWPTEEHYDQQTGGYDVVAWPYNFSVPSGTSAQLATWGCATSGDMPDWEVKNLSVATVGSSSAETANILCDGRHIWTPDYWSSAFQGDWRPSWSAWPSTSERSTAAIPRWRTRTYRTTWPWS